MTAQTENQTEMEAAFEQYANAVAAGFKATDGISRAWADAEAGTVVVPIDDVPAKRGACAETAEMFGVELVDEEVPSHGNGVDLVYEL